MSGVQRRVELADMLMTCTVHEVGSRSGILATTNADDAAARAQPMHQQHYRTATKRREAWMTVARRLPYRHLQRRNMFISVKA